MRVQESAQTNAHSAFLHLIHAARSDGDDAKLTKNLGRCIVGFHDAGPGAGAELGVGASSSAAALADPTVKQYGTCFKSIKSSPEVYTAFLNLMRVFSKGRTSVVLILCIAIV
jgi:hypothetical protein